MVFKLLHLDDVLLSLRRQVSASGLDNARGIISGVWSSGKHLFIATAEGRQLYSFDLSSQSRPCFNEGILLEEFTSSVVSVLVHPSRSHCILVVRMDSITSFWEYLRMERRWVKQCQFQLSNAKGSQVISVIIQVCSLSLFWCENRSVSGPGLSSCCVCRRQLVSCWDSSLPEQLGQVDAVLHSCPFVSLYTVKRELCIVPSMPHKQQLLLFWSYIRRSFKVYVYGHGTAEENLDKTDFRVIYSELLCLMNESINTGHFVSFTTHLTTQELVTVDNYGNVSLVNSPEKQSVLTPLCCLNENLSDDQVDKIFIHGLILVCVGLSGKIYFFHAQSGALLETLDNLKGNDPSFWFGFDELPTVGLFTVTGVWKLFSQPVVDTAACLQTSVKCQKIPFKCNLKINPFYNDSELDLCRTELNQKGYKSMNNSATTQGTGCICGSQGECENSAGEVNSFLGTYHAVNYLSSWDIKHWSAKMALDSVISTQVFNGTSRTECEIPHQVLDLLAGESFQNPGLLLALLWNHSIHRDFARKTAEAFVDKTVTMAADKTSLNKLLSPYMEEFLTLSKKYDAIVNGCFATNKDNFVECIVPESVEGKMILSNLNEQLDDDALRRLSILVDQSPEQLLKSVAEFLNFDSAESDSGGDTLVQCWRKIFRLEWKGGQWRKQKLVLTNFHNSLLNILCQLFYKCQPDWLLRIVDKGLETINSVEGVVSHSMGGRSYEDFITHSVIECLPRLTTERTRNESVVKQAELFLFPGQETESLRLLLQHHLWPQAVDFLSSYDSENYILLFTILLKALLRGRAPSSVVCQALEFVPEGLASHEVLGILRDYAPSSKSPFPQTPDEVKLGDVRGHLEMLLAPR